MTIRLPVARIEKATTDGFKKSLWENPFYFIDGGGT
jgi:hypothetical protein